MKVAWQYFLTRVMYRGVSELFLRFPLIFKTYKDKDRKCAYITKQIVKKSRIGSQTTDIVLEIYSRNDEIYFRTGNDISVTWSDRLFDAFIYKDYNDYAYNDTSDICRKFKDMRAIFKIFPPSEIKMALDSLLIDGV